MCVYIYIYIYIYVEVYVLCCITSYNIILYHIISIHYAVCAALYHWLLLALTRSGSRSLRDGTPMSAGNLPESMDSGSFQCRITNHIILLYIYIYIYIVSFLNYILLVMASESLDGS